MDFRLGERRRKKSAILRLSHFQQLVDQGLGTEDYGQGNTKTPSRQGSDKK
jgi:hypothetical protein